MYKKMILLTLLLLAFGCSSSSVTRPPLPEADFLVIAHRGASAYAPDHTLAAYEMAMQMGADYIELDLQLTKDGKLAALHDTVISLQDTDRSVSDVTFDELQLYAPGKEFNEDNPHYASPQYQGLRVVDLDDILRHFGNTVNYYIELKSPDSYPGIEVELLHQLRAHGLLDTDDERPKVIIQSFDKVSLTRIAEMEPSIPLIQLYSFDKTAHLSKKELRKLARYASGIGVPAETVTKEFVEAVQKEGLDVHPFTINDEATMRTLMTYGINGLFTDKPDIAVRLRDEKRSMDAN
ncbi:glycerophosphodiester phosphodiesterase family protein [Sporosarcina sp. NPDC096371]|uniref:glycerophosphodiester phosphodiesterase family protein n=1 Tax=Sporosarcina sp. NPDC096371 TaxID=3364530 RepID=UPI003817141A